MSSSDCDTNLDSADESIVSRGKRSRLRVWFRRMAQAGIWLILALFVFSFFGQHFFLAELLANFRKQFFGLFLVAAIVSVSKQFGWLISVCSLLALIWTGVGVANDLLPAAQPAAGQTRIRVMSYNVLAINFRFKDAVDEVRKHDPDVVAVIEYANQWHNAFDALNESHPYQLREPRWHGYGIALFSKLPIEEAVTLQLTEEVMDNVALSCTVTLDGQPLRFVASHVMSPINTMRLKLRNRQFEEIADHIRSDDVATILLGDLNCAPSSLFLQRLMHDARLRDSRKGFGDQASWPTWAAPVAIPIDHALVSESVCIHDRFLGDGGGSDHRPVIVEVSVANSSSGSSQAP